VLYIVMAKPTPPPHHPLKNTHPHCFRQKPRRVMLKYFYLLIYSSVRCMCVRFIRIIRSVRKRDREKEMASERERERERENTIFLVADSCWRQQLRPCLANASHNSSFIARVPYPGFYFIASSVSTTQKCNFFSLLQEFPQDCYVGGVSRMWNG